MAITISPSFTESADGQEVLSDFSVNHHHELHRGMAPEYLHVDEATGDYSLDEQPTFRSEEDIWGYDTAVFSDHPILGDGGTAADAAMYWLDHSTQVSEAEISAMLDGLDNYDGIERINREMLIAFKCGDVDFTDLPIEIQEDLIEASGYEPVIASDEHLDDLSFEVYSELATAEQDPELIEVLDELSMNVDDHAVATVAALSARFHAGEDPDALIEEAVQMLGQEAALDAYYKLTNYLNDDH